MAEHTRTEISSLGEFGLIDHLMQDWPLFHATSLTGAGDDAAVIAMGDEVLLISTDMLVEGIHFDLAYHPLKHLGYKATIVNLSDICAMNAIPQQILVSVGISNRFSVEAMDEFYAGIRAACETYQVDLIGGDTCSSGKGFVINLTAIGRAPRSQVVYRSGARPGDLICVTGDLGASYLGLQLLEREKQVYLAHPETQPDLEGQEYLVGRQLKPEARKDVVLNFREYGLKPTAMIDISDGLASELLHICKASGTGARLDETMLPVSPEAEAMAMKFQLDPTTCALHGGEDYELLFTAQQADLEKLRVMPNVFIIGEVMEQEAGVMLQTSGGQVVRITAQGWNHFQPGQNQ